MYKLLLAVLLWILLTSGVYLDSFYTGGSDVKIDNVSLGTSIGDRIYLIQFDHAPEEIVVCFDIDQLTCYAIGENGIEYTDM